MYKILPADSDNADAACGYIQANMHTCMHTYIYTEIHTQVQMLHADRCKPICIHACMHA